MQEYIPLVENSTIFFKPSLSQSSLLSFINTQHTVVMRSDIKENHLDLSQTEVEACNILFVTFSQSFFHYDTSFLVKTSRKLFHSLRVAQQLLHKRV